MNRNTKRFSLIEILIVLVIIAIILRYVFAAEYHAVVDAIFAAVGLGGGLKYLILIPLTVLYYWLIYKREKSAANAKGIPVVSKGVAVFAVASLALVFGFFGFLIYSGGT